MKSDVQKFCRKLRLREFFGYDTSTDNSLVRNKSNWAPNRGRDSHLDCFIDTITKFPITNSKNFKQNISKAEQRALEKLKQDETIVIKEADKGGAIVIMDKDYYREKVLDQLNDGIFYKKHSGKKTVMKKIKHLIEHHPNSVTEKEADYLCNFQIKDSNFYGLPKVHKSSEIITAVEEQKCSYIEVHRPKDLKLRPIVAGPESETQRLSHFLDLILKPICEKIPSFVRDDMDFLNHIPPEVPDSTILASFDVTSLYTNIPHDLGLTAANFWIEKHRDLVDRRFKTDFLLSALQIVLEGNTFNFDGQTYEQMKGTAMGTKVAPTYANLVMGYLEYKLYEKVKDEFDDDFKQYILGQWKRFLDDCGILSMIPHIMFKGQQGRQIQGLRYNFKWGAVTADDTNNTSSDKSHIPNVASKNVYENMDDNSQAIDIYEKVRVLCWVMTYPAVLEKKTIHVKNTWTRRCNVILYFSSENNEIFPTIGLDVEEGREHLTAKTMHAFRYILKHHIDDAEWFMKADDDTYVIVENLRYFLSSKNHSDPVYFGHHFKPYVTQGYHSGGAGYVLSKEALIRFGRSKLNFCREDGGAEDLEMGLCMQKLGVSPGLSTDELGRTRFHCLGLQAFITGSFPIWALQYDYHGLKQGVEAVSDYAVSFHYVSPRMMYELEFFLYHFRLYGIRIQSPTDYPTLYTVLMLPQGIFAVVVGPARRTDFKLNLDLYERELLRYSNQCLLLIDLCSSLPIKAATEDVSITPTSSSTGSPMMYRQLTWVGLLRLVMQCLDRLTQADTMIPLQILDIVRQSDLEAIDVRSQDTDVLILLIDVAANVYLNEHTQRLLTANTELLMFVNEFQ
ncbi:hypothetical protein ScPMuIL_016469 [Solemya velum]